MESAIVKSWKHHKERLTSALDRKDYSTIRDATSVVRELEARMLPHERAQVGLAPR